MPGPKRIEVVFYRTETGVEPVRDWLKDLDRDDRLVIGTDLKTVEFGWPVGMPTCRPMGDGLFEVRSNISGKRISRVMFCIDDGCMVLLHAFVKKQQKTPKPDLDLARRRMRTLTGRT